MAVVYGIISRAITLQICPANEKRRYSVTLSLIGWAHIKLIPVRVLTIVL